MLTSDGYNQELKRDFYRDLAAKQHLATRMAQSRQAFACDATGTETAADYCQRMLEKLGLKSSSDPIQALTLFLAGREGALSAMDGRHNRSALDANDGSPDFVERYVKDQI